MRRPHRRRWIVAVVGVLVVSVGVWTGLAGQLAIGALSISVNGVAAPVRLPPLDQRSVVVAPDGSTVAVLHGPQDRVPVRLNKIAPVLINAVVDTEDAQFWHHGGIDTRAMVRAALHDARAGAVREGGSTITQQLVKNTLLERTRSVHRKLREIVLAVQLERQIGRRGVLERYLNTVYFGENSFGVETAAQTYFGVPAARLTLPQAALLAGLIQSPSSDDPVRHPTAAAARRRDVLDRMVEQHHITRLQADLAARDRLPTVVHRIPQGTDYFTAAVVRDLLGEPALGKTVAERQRRILTGGLRIHTTIDPRLQQIAEATIATGVPGGLGLTGALASIDPATGAVRALVGGTDYVHSPFDAAAQGLGRQAGSAFKMFTLVAALEQGHSPDDVLDGSAPCPVPNPGGTPDPWSPGNFEGEAFGAISLTDATAHSVNCAFARLAHEVGPSHIVDVAHRMGIRAPLAAVPSITLGTSPVPPLQLAAAYATLAADGVAHTPYLVTKVVAPDGHTVFAHKPQAHRAIDAQIARQATAVLTQVVQAGTGRAAALDPQPVAGKTGTAENYQDAWFVGFTPQLTTSVWMGATAGELPMPDVDGARPVGGGRPAQMWHTYTAQALSGQPPVPFVGIDPSSLPSVDASATSPSLQPGHRPGATWCWTSCGMPGLPPPGYAGGGGGASPPGNGKGGGKH